MHEDKWSIDQLVKRLTQLYTEQIVKNKRKLEFEKSSMHSNVAVDDDFALHDDDDDDMTSMYARGQKRRNGENRPNDRNRGNQSRYPRKNHSHEDREKKSEDKFAKFKRTNDKFRGDLKHKASSNEMSTSTLGGKRGNWIYVPEADRVAFFPVKEDAVYANIVHDSDVHESADVASSSSASSVLHATSATSSSASSTTETGAGGGATEEEIDPFAQDEKVNKVDHY